MEMSILVFPSILVILLTQRNSACSYILCKFEWKSCIFIDLEESYILVCHPPERVTIGLTVTLSCANMSHSCKPMKMQDVHASLHKI